MEYLDRINKLRELCDELRQYYDIDKIKSWAIFVWSKNDEENSESGNGLFDICKDRIIYYTNHTIIEEAKPIIEEIQKYLEVLK